jgi:hypothetical protein
LFPSADQVSYGGGVMSGRKPECNIILSAGITKRTIFPETAKKRPLHEIEPEIKASCVA